MVHPSERAVALAALLLATGLAGCVAPAAPAPPPTSEPAPRAIATGEPPQLPRETYVLPPTDGPRPAATTQAPPALVPGEWWRIRFHSRFLGTTELVRVVAEAGPEHYLVGMASDAWSEEALAVQLLAFGEVRHNLSYLVAGETFEPVRFPLEEGATWDTTFFGRARLKATVERADSFTASIHLDEVLRDQGAAEPAYGALNPLRGRADMRLEYDARQHAIVRLETYFATWEVVEHGYGFPGAVAVPRGMALALEYGQFLPVTPGSPVVTRTLSVQGDFDRLALLHVILPLGPGAYRLRSVAPGGTAFVTEQVLGRDLIMRAYGVEAPEGEWTMEDVVAGPGATATVGIAYRLKELRPA